MILRWPTRNQESTAVISWVVPHTTGWASRLDGRDTHGLIAALSTQSSFSCRSTTKQVREPCSPPSEVLQVKQPSKIIRNMIKVFWSVDWLSVAVELLQSMVCDHMAWSAGMCWSKQCPVAKTNSDRWATQTQVHPHSLSSCAFMSR